MSKQLTKTSTKQTATQQVAEIHVHLLCTLIRQLESPISKQAPTTYQPAYDYFLVEQTSIR